MHEDLKERLKKLENNYNKEEFLSIVNTIKKDKTNDDELLEQVENISLKRFRDKVSLTLGILPGNALEITGTIAALALPYWMNNDLGFYICALILMATLHPLSHFLAGMLVGIRFTHYYLNGPARIEPTLRINYFSYLKTKGEKRALMHVSGVIGTLLAPLIAAQIAYYSGSVGAAQNLIYFFLLLVVFELLTSTKIGDFDEDKEGVWVQVTFMKEEYLEKSASIRELPAGGLKHWKEKQELNDIIGLVKSEGDAVESKKLIQKGLK